jgi:putative FmdB family regulatory protein
VPIFEYRCTACDHRFETIVRDATPPACPKCDSRELQKELSVFAVGAPATAPRPSPCATCGDPRGRGSCPLN